MGEGVARVEEEAARTFKSSKARRPKRRPVLQYLLAAMLDQVLDLFPVLSLWEESEGILCQVTFPSIYDSWMLIFEAETHAQTGAIGRRLLQEQHKLPKRQSPDSCQADTRSTGREIGSRKCNLPAGSAGIPYQGHMCPKCGFIKCIGNI